MPMRYFAVLVGVIAAAVTALAVAEPYRLQRLTSFTDPFKDAQGSGFHTVESLYALGSGGIFGVGLGEGTSKYWVPNANSDYVFAIIGEELGLLGCGRGARPVRAVRLHRHAGRPAQRRPVRPPGRRRRHDLAVRPGRHQHRLRHRAAAGDRHPAAVHLGRWHLAARVLLRARHARLLRPARGPCGHRRAPRRTPAADARAGSAGCASRCPGPTSRRAEGREPTLEVDP